MIMIYIISTLGIAIGWIKNLSIIASKPWLERMFFLISFILLTWCSIDIVSQTSHLDDDWSFIYLGCYFGYLLILSVIFYNLVNFLSKKLDDIQW